MPTKKQERVAEQIQQILSEIIQFEVSDPRITGITVMEVTIDRELMYATIYVSSMGGDEEQETVLQGLHSAAGFLRRELGSRMHLRRVPDLRFKWDETFEYAARIDSLLDSLDIQPADDEDENEDDQTT